jgi:hypothetical protein
MRYIIISPEKGSAKKPTFWRSNDAGYTNSPFAAGIYTEEQIKANPDYYNNGYSAVAVPLTDEAMRLLGFSCSYNEKGLNNFLQKDI